MKKTLILGLGNTILSDDGAGLIIARQIKKYFPRIDVKETSLSGAFLLDYIVEYERLIIIDSIKTGETEPGTVHKLSLNHLKTTVAEGPPHGLNLATVIELAKIQGEKIPDIDIYAIEIEDNTTFSERLTATLENKLPQIIKQIVEDLQNTILVCSN